GGLRPPGTECRDTGDNACECFRLPLQGACAEADAPACGGVCAAETICQPNGTGGCACEPFVAQEQTCFAENAPECAGACASGGLCGVDQSACSCFAPCELSEAPGCGGACFDVTLSCVFTTA